MVRRKVYHYACSGAVQEGMRNPKTDSTMVHIMADTLKRHCAENRLQMLGEPTINWEYDSANPKWPWQIFGSCEALKLGRRKKPYPLSGTKGLSWVEIDLAVLPRKKGA